MYGTYKEVEGVRDKTPDSCTKRKRSILTDRDKTVRLLMEVKKFNLK